MIQSQTSKIDPFKNLLQNNYQQLVGQKQIEFDAAQMPIIEHLQNLLEQLIEHDDFANKPLYQRLLTLPPEPAKNIYIYGDVGRGKSMLMDLFFEACPIKHKRRVHFLTFMKEVHEHVHQCRQRKQDNAIPELAKKIRATTLILCFDEFHVSDIADAMIMIRLFGQLYKLGLIIVATSNIPPDDLYRGGIQRDSFLPFIRMLLETSEVIKLDAKQDYRCSNHDQEFAQQNYYWPLNQDADAFLLNQFDKLTDNAKKTSKTLKILGHQLTLTIANDTFAYTNFTYLCGQALGPADYLTIAQQFTHLFIANIPELTLRQRNEAKRFVTLIDALYEHKVKLICTAETSANLLYTEGKSAFEFKRTTSRLTEMQSLNYWQSDHIP